MAAICLRLHVHLPPVKPEARTSGQKICAHHAGRGVGTAGRAARPFLHPRGQRFGRIDRKRHVLVGAGGVCSAETATRHHPRRRLAGATADRADLSGSRRRPHHHGGAGAIAGARRRGNVADVVARMPDDHDGRAVRSTSSVGMPQVPLRTVSTRVPGLRPGRTSDTSTPAETSRARVASMSATRQLMPHSRSCRLSAARDPGPVHDFDNEFAAAKEHQAAPIGTASGRAPCPIRARAP